MASAWQKRETWYFGVMLKSGERHQSRVPARADGSPVDRKYAKKFADAAQARYDAGLWDPAAPSAPAAKAEASTVRQYGETWLAGITNANAEGDARMFRLHVLPRLGKYTLAEVRPRHVREFVEALKAAPSKRGGKLAPRTVRNLYSLVQRMFARAEADEVIPSTPCKIPRNALPPIVDKDPMARQTWVRTPAEVRALVCDARVPPDRRVLYALEFLTGARFSELAILRWRAWARDLAPLGRITIAYSRDMRTGLEKSTKKGAVRQVPVHPTLAGILEDWHARGFEAHYGRPPRESDFIVPTRGMDARDVRNGWTRHAEDCAKLGVVRRRQHDARRTFISLALAGGARRDVLEWITHDAAAQSVMNQYTTLPWTTLCEAVSALAFAPCAPSAP